MDQFSNPSAIAPFRQGYLLLEGMGTGSDDRHGLELKYGPVETADQLPKFSSITFEDQASGNAETKPSNVVTQNGVYERSVPSIFALDDSTLEVVYLGMEGGTNGIWGHTFYDDGTTLLRVTALQQFATPFTEPATFAAAIVPGQSGALIASLDEPSLENPDVNFYWCSLPASTPGQPVELDVQQVTSSIAGGGELSLVVVVNSSDGTSDEPYLGFLSCNMGNLLDINIYRVGFANGVLSINPVYENGMEQGNGWPQFSLFRGADGIAYYQLASGGFTVGSVAADGTLTGNVSLGISGISRPAPVYFTFGDFNPEPVVNEQQTVPVYRTFLFDSGSGKIGQVGQAQRTVYAQDQLANQQGVVIGIIESGPPVPNENLAGLSPHSNEGSTTFGETTTNTTGWSLNSSIGGFFQGSGSSGIAGCFAVTQQFKVTFGATGSFSQQTTTQQIQSTYANSEIIQGDSGQLMINPQGMALVGYCSYIGYRYVFLDTNGSPDPLAPPYYELYPTSWEINALPFDIDPTLTAGVVPGNLLSYQMDAAAENQLKQNLLNEGSIASLAWDTEGGAQTSNVFITEGSKSVGAYSTFEYSIGATIGPPDENVSVSAGLQASFNFNYTWTTSQSDQMQTSVSLGALDQPPPPGAFSSYRYDALLLGHNSQFTEDLVAALQNYPTSNNAAALARIAPNSAPWKIVHVVTAYELAGTGSPPEPAEPPD